MTTILIVEDDPTMRMLLVIGQERLGHTVFEAGDGVEALAMLHAHPSIEAVSLDIFMPRMGGWETLRAIREGWPEMPVVMVSALNSEANQQNAIRQGVPYLRKPVSPDVLAEAIEMVRRGGYGHGH